MNDNTVRTEEEEVPAFWQILVTEPGVDCDGHQRTRTYTYDTERSGRGAFAAYCRHEPWSVVKLLAVFIDPDEFQWVYVLSTRYPWA